LTPSPVIATISPFAFSACTSLSFCSGAMRANTSAWRTASRTSSPDIASTCAPVTTRPSCGRPIRRAIACAVPG
jgi:hypothetical protein